MGSGGGGGVTGFSDIGLVQPVLGLPSPPNRCQRRTVTLVLNLGTQFGKVMEQQH